MSHIASMVRVTKMYAEMYAEMERSEAKHVAGLPALDKGSACQVCGWEGAKMSYGRWGPMNLGPPSIQKQCMMCGACRYEKPLNWKQEPKPERKRR